jgi:hypothetical protein
MNTPPSTELPDVAQLLVLIDPYYCSALSCSLNKLSISQIPIPVSSNMKGLNLKMRRPDLVPLFFQGRDIISADTNNSYAHRLQKMLKFNMLIKPEAFIPSTVN